MKQLELFNVTKIEDLFSNYESMTIKSLLKIELSNLDENKYEEIANGAVQKVMLKVPVIDTSKIELEIQERQIDPRDLPSGKSFIKGRPLVVDVARYTIPFSGEGLFFEIIPRTHTPKIIEAELSGKFLYLNKTKFGKLKGNDAHKNEIKEEITRDVEWIQENLSSIQKEYNEFAQKLKHIIVSKLHQLKKDKESDQRDADDLNPFK